MKETRASLQLKLAHAVEALDRTSEENEKFKTRLREQMRAFGVITHTDTSQMLEIVLRQERKHTEEAIVGAKDFRDSCLIMLKSLEVVIESVECAGTHSEKNARLRGLADVVQRNIDRLGRFEFCFDRSPWHAAYVDAFAREDPRVMKLREKVSALEAKLNPMEPREKDVPF